MPVDLIAPAELVSKAGRRGARLPGEHGKTAWPRPRCSFSPTNDHRPLRDRSSPGSTRPPNLDLSPGADLEAVEAALVRAAPGISISGIDSPDRGRLISTYTSLITAATIVAILLSLAATLAAVADRSLEGRRHATHLTALGLPPNTLRNAETLTLVAPLAIGIVTAGLATVFSALTYFQLAESPIELPVSSVAIIFGIGGVGAALTAIIAYTTTSVTHPTTALRTE